MSIVSYKTIKAASYGEFKDRGSKFIAYAFPLHSLENWVELLDNVKKEHSKARHHCFAWRYGYDGNQFRANDDGEPSGTAGKPILGQIDSLRLTNVLVVVVRYFGGVLLGTGGLIHAYRESTALALQNAVIIDKKPTTDFNIFFDYSILGELMEILKRLECPIIQKDFHSNPSLTICIPTYEADLILLTIKAHLYKVSMEEAAKLKDASGLKIIRLE